MKKKVLGGMLLTSMLILGTAPIVGDAASGQGWGTPENNLSENTDRGFLAKPEAKARSTAEFEITEGNLTLDRVPDMRFARIDQGNPTVEQFNAGPVELTLQDGEVKELSGEGELSKNNKAWDGNKDLALQVSDYRGASTAGWDLKVNVSDFFTKDGKTLRFDTMTLTPSNAGWDTQAVELVANADKTLVFANSNEHTLGTHLFNFASGRQNRINFNTRRSVDSGVYQATMTWTLTNSYRP